MKKLVLGLLIVWSGSSIAYDASLPVSDTNPPPVHMPLQQDLINNINSFQPTRQMGNMFGMAVNINNVRCDVWEGPTCIYVFPATAQQMALSSTSASDALAGTGCQKMTIYYLDANYAMQQETDSLNGLTAVNTTATNILRVNGMRCVQVGSGGISAGNISLKNLGATVTYNIIMAGYDTARTGVYTIPAGKYGYLSSWQVGSGTATGTHFTMIDLRSTSAYGVSTPGAFSLLDEMGTLNSGNVINLPTPIRVPPMTDVKCSAISDAANAAATVTCAAWGWIENQ